MLFRSALQGGTSNLQLLNQGYVAFQLSIAAGSGTFPSSSILASSIRCYGVNFTPVRLANGFTLTRNTSLSDLLVQTREVVLENRTDDMAKLATIFGLLNGTDPNNRCR